MADKQISQLTEATAVGASDLFVLEQSGAAKKLTGSTLEQWLLAMANGHGGIASIAKTGTAGLVDTYTITYADNSTSTFIVTNGADGTNGTNGTNGADGTTFTPSVSAQGVISWTNDGGKTNPTSVNIKGASGDNAYVWIKWASEEPTQDADMGDVPDEWIGIYSGASSTAPTAYTSYTWYKVKGATGASGADGTPITAVTRTSGDGSPGTDDTYTFYVDSDAVGTAIIHNGTDGVGTVNSVNEIGVDAGTNNITLTAADVNAPKVPLHLTATVTSLPKTISDANITATMRVIECTWGTAGVILSNISWTTSAGSIVLTGTMSGSTTVDLVLIETT